MGAETVEGYVTVYESSDGGSGDPHETFWQFRVYASPEIQPFVTTRNHRLAETMRFAMDTKRKVKVTYDAAAPYTMSQARIEDAPPPTSK
jgi:methionine synthase II (cobalamin-independent)